MSGIDGYKKQNMANGACNGLMRLTCVCRGVEARGMGAFPSADDGDNARPDHTAAGTDA